MISFINQYYVTEGTEENKLFEKRCVFSADNVNVNK